MTVCLSGQEVAKQIAERFPDAVSEASDSTVLVKSESLFEVAQYLKSKPELDFDYLTYITAVDYYDYFEVVYQLTSLKHNHSLVLKTRCYDRDRPVVQPRRSEFPSPALFSPVSKHRPLAGLATFRFLQVFYLLFLAAQGRE